MEKQQNIFKKTIAIAAIATISAIIAATLAIGFYNSQQQERWVQIDGMLPPFHISDLAKQSKFVIIGTVVDKTSQTSVDQAHSITRVTSGITINVEKDLKGQYARGSQITVKTLGGQADGVQTTSDITPAFSSGERVLVFVADKDPTSIWGDNYYVMGMKLGKYSLANGKSYGPEHQDGIDEKAFVAEIQQALAASG